jgi:hypothetical protein
MPFTPQCQSFIQRPPFKVAMIRLLYQKPDGTFAFFSPRRRENHEYGMLSHVWQIDEEDEVTYQDILDNTGHTKLGYRKLQLCADWARHDGIRYFWCDTCCINQASSVEQNEAITCMFQSRMSTGNRSSSVPAGSHGVGHCRSSSHPRRSISTPMIPHPWVIATHCVKRSPTGRQSLKRLSEIRQHETITALKNE